MSQPMSIRWTARTASALIVLLALALLAPVGVSYGAVSVPENIRVALYYDIGARASKIGAVTLQSAGGLRLVWRDGGRELGLGSVGAGRQARFALDGYRALVLETADRNAALAAQQKLQASSNAVRVTQLVKKGQTVYQVTEGAYPTAAAAQSALAKWTAAGAAGGQTSLTPPAVLGPYAVEAGPYASEAEAAAGAAVFGDAGFDAFVARKPTADGLAYVVRVGQLADAGGLAALQQAAGAGQRTRVPAADEPYVVVRQEIAANGFVPLYALPLASSAQLRAEPAGDAPIELQERSKRAYRGVMEISAYNSSLTVVNEVNFEQYLYAVVGSEVPAGWHPEAIKAQAVAARTYALSVGNLYQIAQVDDTTYTQAYYGVGQENPQATAAVDATRGVVLTYGGKPISAVFSANAGGVTADPSEVWGNPVPYVSSAVASPDTGPQQGLRNWYKVALPTGEVGYIREDLVSPTGQTNPAGAPLLRVSGNGVAVRPAPLVQNDAEPVARVDAGTIAVQLDLVPESNNYAWIEGPVRPETLLAAINARAKTKIAGPLRTLEVGSTGPSGRALYVVANGVKVELGNPDSLRGALGGLKSTLFEIEETGRYTALAGDGNVREFPQQGGALYVMGADGAARAYGGDHLFILNGEGELRAATAEPAFVFKGKGFGHGLGMSQWGAQGLALQGYDYQAILQYYYQNASLEKGAAS